MTKVSREAGGSSGGWSSLGRLAAVTAFVAVGVAACGSSNKTSSATTAPGGTSASGGSGANATGSLYTVGVISTASGVGTAGTSNDVSTTVHNWAAYTNSHGGINGHPIKVVYYDDHQNAAEAATDAQNLIQGHVLAILDASAVNNAFEKPVDAAKIPVLSLTGSEASFLYAADPNFFADSTTVPALVFSETWVSHYAGAKTMAMFYCAEAPACSQAVPLEKLYGAANQVKIAYSAAIAAAAPNYTAQCLAAKSSGSQTLFIAAANTSEIERVAANCAAQGYTPTQITASGTVPDSALSLPGFGHVIGEVNTFPSFLDNTPATKLYHQVMDSYLPHAQRPVSVAATWTGLELFAAAAAHAGDNPTTQSIYNGLYSLNGSTLGGLAPPLTFKPGQPNNINCFYVVESKNGQYTAPNGDTPVCVNPPPLSK